MGGPPLTTSQSLMLRVPGTCQEVLGKSAATPGPTSFNLLVSLAGVVVPDAPFEALGKTARLEELT